MIAIIFRYWPYWGGALTAGIILFFTAPGVLRTVAGEEALAGREWIVTAVQFSTLAFCVSLAIFAAIKAVALERKRHSS